MHKITTKLQREDLILSEQPAISPSAIVTDCMVGEYTEIAADVWMVESKLGINDYKFGTTLISEQKRIKC